MSDKEYSFRYWVVNCLGCRNPIPLYAEPVDFSAAPAPTTGDSGLATERPYFALGARNVDASILICPKR